MARFNWLFIRGAQPRREQGGEDEAGNSSGSGGAAEELGFGGITTGGFSGLLQWDWNCRHRGGGNAVLGSDSILGRICQEK